jgi:tetratricopeptide (TPR) repeat protein
VVTRKRRIVFLTACLLLPWVVLIVLEVGLRLAGWGYPTSYLIRKREAGRDVFVTNPRFAWRFFPPSIARTPQPLMVHEVKPRGTLRIVVLGESAAMGDPEPSYGLARQLERALRARAPGRSVEVLNLSMTAIDSRVMLEIARDCPKLQADYWVVYAGNNEVIGPFGLGSVFNRWRLGPRLVKVVLALKTTRIGQLVEQVVRGRGEPPEWKGMEAFLHLQIRAGDVRLKSIYENYSANLAEVVRLGQRAGASVLLATMAVNLADSPPFGSLHRADLSSAERVAWDSQWTTGNRAQANADFGEAIRAFEGASAIDAEYAELRFRRAVCDLKLGNKGSAATNFFAAREFDTLRFRADRYLNGIVRRTAKSTGVTLVDAEEECNRRSADGIAGEDIFYDHVHLNFSGNFRVAQLIAAAVEARTTTDTVATKVDPLGEEQVEQQLAFTDFDRLRIAEEMRARMQQAPFRQQSNFQSRDNTWRTRVERSRKPPRESIPGYERALKLDPNDWVLCANFARLLESCDELARAGEQWREVTRLMPNDAEGWLGLAGVSGQMQHGVEAEDCCRKALELQGDSAEVFNQLGLLASGHGDRSEAIRQFRQALRFRPGSNVSRINYAAELALTGDFTGATNQYREVLRRDSANLGARNNLASLLIREGQGSEARDLLQSALALDAEHPQTHYNLARLCAREGRHVEAVGHYSVSLKARPDFPQARLALGLELAELGNGVEALQEMARAAALAPRWSDARFNYGVCLAKAGRYAEAAEEFEATLKLEPTHGSARKFLGQVREMSRGAKK